MYGDSHYRPLTQEHIKAAPHIGYTTAFPWLTDLQPSLAVLTLFLSQTMLQGRNELLKL
jgi:hypothetical protein